MRIGLHAVIGAGLAGTLGHVGTVGSRSGSPPWGLPRMNPADLLATRSEESAILGWVGRLMIGTILALIYAAFLPPG